MAPSARKTKPATMEISGALRQRDRSSGADVETVGYDAMLFQPRFQLRRHFIHRPEVTALQRAHVGDNRPAIVDGDLRLIWKHRAFAVSNCIKNFAVRLRNHDLLVQAANRGIAILLHNAVAIARRTVTGQAINLEPLSTAGHELLRHWKRN